MMPGMVDYRDDPTAQIFADTEAAMMRVRRTAETAGCRLLSTLRLDDGIDAVSMAMPAALILIELENEAAGEAAVPLLDWLQQEAGRGARRGVVSAPRGLIDLVAASANHAGIEHLCEADEAERLAAVARAIAPVASRLCDEGDEGGAGGARVLQRPLDYAPDPAGPADLPFIHAMLRARRLRDEHFPADLFADPAWDILLDLMAARLERTQVTVSSLCVAAAVPPTTALRWIGVLAERDLLVRVADHRDRRRAYVELSEAAARALGGWLRQARHLAEEAL